ncbi:YggT family protein [Sandarakinorhabdus sp.]|uniref:YggT family protein n=1 Tax=Sandarakinorhabdus sp. TaxID=1916663 RepID=UPI00286EB394|nr:YggT family protein [Sandarakinorhabdus sp.]
MENTAVALVNIFTMATQVLIWGLVVWAISSWLVAFNIVNTRNPVVSGILNALDKIYGPMVRPIRRFLPDFGGIDLSPLVLWLVLSGVQQLVPALVMDTGLLQ